MKLAAAAIQLAAMSAIGQPNPLVIYDEAGSVPVRAWRPPDADRTALAAAEQKRARRRERNLRNRRHD